MNDLPTTVVATIAIYDGRRHLGEVEELDDGQFAAFDTGQKHLGIFDKKAEAERAVLAQRRPS